MKHLISPLAGAVLIGLGSFVSPSAVLAQGADDFVVEEIVVTARRRSESLQDVPGTVTAITSDVIKGAGIRRAEGFVQLTPGVTMVNNVEAGDTQVNIRGINGARDAENSFALLIDGILHTNPAAFNREYSNLQQIEIFKGPQGAIYGRSAAAGAVIITTEKPGNDTSFEAVLSAAGDDTIAGLLSYSTPLIEDKLYLSLSADMRQSDGFYENRFQNNAAIVDAFDGQNFNARLVWDVSDALEIDTKLHYGEVDASSFAFNSIFHLPVFAAVTDTPAANQDSNDVNFVYDPNIISDNDQEAFEFSSKFEYAMENTTLTGWMLYSDIENNLMSDGTSAAFGFYAPDAVCQQTITDLNAAGYQLQAPQFIGQTPNGVIFDPERFFPRCLYARRLVMAFKSSFVIRRPEFRIATGLRR